MDLQDSKTLDARIRSALSTQANPTPAHQAYLRERLLDRASQQTILPPSPFARLKRNLLAGIGRTQDVFHVLGVVFMEDDRYHRAYYHRAIDVSYYTRKHKLGRLAGDYLEPLRYNMMKINVY